MRLDAAPDPIMAVPVVHAQEELCDRCRARLLEWLAKAMEHCDE